MTSPTASPPNLIPAHTPVSQSIRESSTRRRPRTRRILTMVKPASNSRCLWTTPTRCVRCWSEGRKKPNRAEPMRTPGHRDKLSPGWASRYQRGTKSWHHFVLLWAKLVGAILSQTVLAAEAPNPGTPWPAVDALGRPLPLFYEVGPPKPDR